MSFIVSQEELFESPIQDAGSRPSSWFVHVAAYFIRPVLKICFRYKVLGRENIPAADEQPVIFAANHTSFADPCVLWVSAYPRITRFLARSSLFRPIIGGLIARVGGLPVDPDSADRKAIKRAVACLKRGECVGIFPEGTRMNKPEKEYHPHAGMILMAQMAKCPIVPVGITGADRIMPPGAHFLRFPKITITYGEPISLEDYADYPKAERTEKALADVMERVFALRDAAK